MLRVTLELVPFGQENQKQTIGVTTIHNDGTGTSEVGNYEALIEKDGKSCGVRVKKFPRALGAWALVRYVLEKAGA